MPQWCASCSQRSGLPASWPYRGRPGPDHAGRRERVVAGHRLLYRLSPGTGDPATAGDAEIIRVFGPGQDARLR